MGTESEFSWVNMLPVYRFFQIVVRGGGGRGDFVTRWWEPAEWFWWFKAFSKLKTAFCEYWTSIKIKINVTCVPKEYETKTKMVQDYS